MKTSVNMIRKMGNFNVTQRTKDSMFNATELGIQYSKSTGQRKDVSDFLRLDSTKEYIAAIQEDTLIREFPYLKSKGRYGGTWMHPYLFLDFAMWLNPKFKLHVIKFVYDQLMEFRHSAGDMYIGLSTAVKRFEDVDYIRVAKGLNYIVFGFHKTGMRQTATELQLKELTQLQIKLAFAIDMSYIKTFDSLMNEMNKLYHSKKELIMV